MVGLSVVLEGRRSGSSSVHRKKSPQVISKATMSMVINGAAPHSPTPTSSSPSSLSRRNSLPFSVFPAPAFLDQCFLCKSKLLPGKDIYIGDRAFCSVECRCRQIFMDEEETLRKDNCSMAAIKPASSSSSSSPSSTRHSKGTRNKPGGFAY